MEEEDLEGSDRMINWEDRRKFHIEWWEARSKKCNMFTEWDRGVF